MAGSLLIAVRVAAHPLLVRDGFDLYLELPISFTQSITGARVKIPTIEGTTEIEIPQFTQNGAKQVLRGKGIKRLRQIGYGDLVVKILVEMPQRVDKRTLELIRSLDTIIDGREYDKRRAYLDKLNKL
jgi:molecular chaperone DnaJ